MIGGLYEVKGSFDGKTWYSIVPRQEIKSDPAKLWVYSDVQLKDPIEAKFIRTYIYRLDVMIQGKLRRQDALLTEQLFNLQELPEILSEPAGK